MLELYVRREDYAPYLQKKSGFGSAFGVCFLPIPLLVD
jgi:hypothetical protein